MLSNYYTIYRKDVYQRREEEAKLSAPFYE
jgi:hypothetical protein